MGNLNTDRRTFTVLEARLVDLRDPGPDSASEERETLMGDWRWEIATRIGFAKADDESKPPAVAGDLDPLILATGYADTLAEALERLASTLRAEQNRIGAMARLAFATSDNMALSAYLDQRTRQVQS